MMAAGNDGHFVRLSGEWLRRQLCSGHVSRTIAGAKSSWVASPSNVLRITAFSRLAVSSIFVRLHGIVCPLR
jgi:hypothetical protein